MLSLNLEPGDPVASRTYPNLQHSLRMEIDLFVAMFDSILKPKISLGFLRLSTAVDNSVCNLFLFCSKKPAC